MTIVLRIKYAVNILITSVFQRRSVWNVRSIQNAPMLMEVKDIVVIINAKLNLVNVIQRNVNLVLYAVH